MKRGLSEFDLAAIAGGDGNALVADVDGVGEDDLMGVPEAPKAAANRHKARRVGKGFKCCRACGQNKPEQEFAVNQVVDVWCKKALDNISRMARNQGADAEEFFKESRADPAKCKKMLESYGKAYKAWSSGKTSKINWSIIQYKERLKAESGTTLSGNSQMMWEKQAVKFWMSVDGGALSEDEADAKWKALAGRVGEEDQLGPTKKPLRIARWPGSESLSSRTSHRRRPTRAPSRSTPRGSLQPPTGWRSGRGGYGCSASNRCLLGAGYGESRRWPSF